MLKSRQQFPPGGWVFFQPETSWSAPKWVDFNTTVSAIIEHRRANPRFNLSLDRAVVENELEAYTAARLKSQYGDAASQWLTDISAGPPADFLKPRPQRQRQGQNAVAGVANYVRQTVAGIGLWMEFFGSGPVVADMATARASVCVRCPLNQPATGALAFSEIAAKELTAILGSLRERKLSTPLDDRLHVCAACLCPLRAKVWAPIEIVKKHLTPEAAEKLWPECWIRR